MADYDSDPKGFVTELLLLACRPDNDGRAQHLINKCIKIAKAAGATADELEKCRASLKSTYEREACVYCGSEEIRQDIYAQRVGPICQECWGWYFGERRAVDD